MVNIFDLPAPSFFFSFNKFITFSNARASYTAYQATELDKASDLLQAMKQDFVLAKVDCIGSGKDTCAKHEIQNIDEYPKMQVFRRGRMGQEYSGPDDAGNVGGRTCTLRYILS